MGQNESKSLQDGALTLLQALNDLDQEIIDQCLKHESVKKMIYNNVKISQVVNRRESFFDVNITCLCYASHCNGARTVRQSVQAGADVTASDSTGYTPLHWGSVSGIEAKQKVEYLLSCDASLIRARTNNNNTPLHRAALNGNDTVISVLIQHCAEVNERGQFGRTALHDACNKGHVACIHELMKHGADVEARDSTAKEATPLQLAAYFNHPDCVKVLLDKYSAAINATDNIGDTALHCAAMMGNLEVVKLLTSYSQCDVNTKNSNGETAADLARACGHNDVVDYLKSVSSVTAVTSSLASQQSVDSGISSLPSHQSAANVTSSTASGHSIESGISSLTSNQTVASLTTPASPESVDDMKATAAATGLKVDSKVYGKRHVSCFRKLCCRE